MALKAEKDRENEVTARSEKRQKNKERNSMEEIATTEFPEGGATIYNCSP